MTADLFVVAFASLFTGHHLGDYLLQTSWQVEHKGDRGAIGWAAASGHVASYTAATIATTLAAGLALDVHITVLGFVVGQLFSAATHLIIDRRFTLRWLMVQVNRVIRGKLAYYDNGGAAFLDQMAHVFCLFIAALLMAVIQ